MNEIQLVDFIHIYGNNPSRAMSCNVQSPVRLSTLSSTSRRGEAPLLEHLDETDKERELLRAAQKVQRRETYLKRSGGQAV